MQSEGKDGIKLGTKQTNRMQETLDLSDHSLLKSQPKNKVKVVDRKERKKEDNKDMGRRQEKYKREQEREAE